jgi:hypothetical protein
VSDATCVIVEDSVRCIKPVKNKTHRWCVMHYTRWLNHGDPLFVKQIRNNQDKRWTSKVDDSGGPDSCHPWLGGINAHGYGTYQIDGKNRLAHDVAWERVHGQIPFGKEIDHECHNRDKKLGLCLGGDSCLHRRCVNERHLKDKTRQEHVDDSPDYERVKGAEHGHSVFSEPQVLDIKADLAAGITAASLARKHQVSESAIRHIKQGRSWGWLTPSPSPN